MVFAPGTNIAIRQRITQDHPGSRDWKAALPLDLVRGEVGADFGHLSTYQNVPFLGLLTCTEVTRQHMSSRPAGAVTIGSRLCPLP